MSRVELLLSETGAGVDNLAEGALTGVRGGLESRLHIDADDVFAFTVPKTVTIRDAKLGFCYYLFVLVALVFAFGNVILSRSYLAEHPAVMVLDLAVSPDTLNSSAHFDRRFDAHDLGLDGTFHHVMLVPFRFSEQEEVRDVECLKDLSKACPWQPHDKSYDIVVDDPLSFELTVTATQDATWHANVSGTVAPLGECQQGPDLTFISGACASFSTFRIQLRDAMANAGWTFKTCNATVGRLPVNGSKGSEGRFVGQLKQGSCEPAAPLAHGPSLEYRRSVMQPAAQDGLYYMSAWNQTSEEDLSALREPEDVQVTFACGPISHGSTDYCILPSFAGQAKVILDVVFENACRDSIWGCIRRYGMDYFLGRVPPSAVVSFRAAGYMSGADSDEDVDAYSNQAVYKYGAYPDKRVVRFSEYVAFIAEVSGVMLHFSVTGLVTTLSGYSFLFTTCLVVVKFVAIYLMKNKHRYGALVTQKSMDFSSLDDFEKLHQKVAPNNPGSSLQGILLHEAVQKAADAKEKGPYLKDDELLTVLVAMEHRLTLLDAAGLGSSDDRGHAALEAYLKARTAELERRHG